MKQNLDTALDINSPLHEDVGITRHIEDTSMLAQDIFQLRADKMSNAAKINRKLERISLIFLIVLGVVAGIVNGLVIMGTQYISALQATIIASDGGDYSVGLFTFMTTSGILVFCAAFLCKHVSNRAAGSGLPELKSLLSSDLNNDESERLVSKRALFSKCIGLMLALGSCLSVGSEGPLVHTAACISFFLVRSTSYCVYI